MQLKKLNKRPITKVARLPIADNENELRTHTAAIKTKTRGSINTIPFMTAMLAIFALSLTNKTLNAMPTNTAIRTKLRRHDFNNRLELGSIFATYATWKMNWTLFMHTKIH